MPTTLTSLIQSNYPEFTGGTVPNAVNITNNTSSGSTSTGALIVTGGVGVGGTLNANRLTSSVATGTAPLTVASTTQVANLNAAFSGASTNLLGGTANRIPYQTAADTTSFITAPSTPSTYLSWNGTAFTWATAGGGSGSPGGADTQIQYNGAGSFAGSANFTYNATNNTVSLIGTDPELVLGGITTEPPAPAANSLTLYAKSVGGRMMPKWVGPTGFDVPIQSSFAFNKIAWWNPPGNATTVPGVVGFSAVTAIGTATARNVAATNAFTRARRLGYNSAATGGSAGGHFSPAANIQYTVGSGTVGVGGFYYVCRFGSADTVASAIMFVGMSNNNATPTVTASPATFTNSIGVGCATGDTNLSIYYGGSAAQTPIALGASFPAKTNSTDLYELVLFAPSNSATTVHYRVTNISTNAQTSGTLTAATAGTQLPASTTFLGHRAYRSNNATATAVLIDIVSVYIETDT